MRIDNTTQIQNPTITLSWSWQVPNILVSAKYENERNSFGRQIGQFSYDNGWQWQPNEGNTSDVNEYFKDLAIEDLNIDNLTYYQPPTLSTYRVAIPTYWEMLFPNDRFIVGGFDIALERTTDNVLCVDIAYLEWKAFQEELQKTEHTALVRQMGAVMVYLKKEADEKKFTEIPESSSSSETVWYNPFTWFS
jgi:hypothetical protein